MTMLFHLRASARRFAALRLLLAAGAFLVSLMAMPPSFAWQADNGDGTFKNPVLYADYPDPDITRVGDDFYMVSTTFVDAPGNVILHSKDLVNWEIVSHTAPVVDGGSAYDMIGGTAYRQGFWAASIRYSKGTFYVVANPRFGKARIYYAANIAGPWRYHELDRATHDPGLFIDTDGTGYIVCGNTHLSLLKLNADFSQVVSTTEIMNAPGLEGSHLIKREDYYYLFNADPAVQPFPLMCSRSKAISGPYETVKVLDDPTGGHQGGIVELADGQWYGFVMKDSGAIGRMTYLCPIFWQDGWPVWGTKEAPGRVPATARKPIQGQKVMQPATSDDFSARKLGLQWQWNHNPDDTRWSLTERPGWLRLKPTQAAEFWLARNTITQKGQGPWSRGEVKLDVSHLRPGDTCGFGTLGKENGQIAVNCGSDGKLSLSMKVIEDLGPDGRKTDVRVASAPLPAKAIYLRTDLDFQTRQGACAYSVDGKEWTPLGGAFPLAFDWRTGTFQGEKFAIFCFNPEPGAGFVDVDSFRFTDRK